MTTIIDEPRPCFHPCSFSRRTTCCACSFSRSWPPPLCCIRLWRTSGCNRPGGTSRCWSLRCCLWMERKNFEQREKVFEWRKRAWINRKRPGHNGPLLGRYSTLTEGSASIETQCRKLSAAEVNASTSNELNSLQIRAEGCWKWRRCIAGCLRCVATK